MEFDLQKVLEKFKKENGKEGIDHLRAFATGLLVEISKLEENKKTEDALFYIVHRTLRRSGKEVYACKSMLNETKNDHRIIGDISGTTDYLKATRYTDKATALADRDLLNTFREGRMNLWVCISFKNHEEYLKYVNGKKK